MEPALVRFVYRYSVSKPRHATMQPPVLPIIYSSRRNAAHTTGQTCGRFLFHTAMQKWLKLKWLIFYFFVLLAAQTAFVQVNDARALHRAHILTCIPWAPYRRRRWMHALQMQFLVTELWACPFLGLLWRGINGTKALGKMVLPKKGGLI